jgi:acylphosphatase
MSTKTTFKRIALVAVAALGLGVLSVAPSSATITGLTVTPVAGTSAAGASDSTTAATISIAGFIDNLKDTVTVEIIENGARPTAVSSYTAGVPRLFYLETSTATSVVNKSALGTSSGTYTSQQSATDSITVGAVNPLKLFSGTAGAIGAKFGVQLDSVTAPLYGTYNYYAVVKSYSAALGDTFTLSTQYVPFSITVAKPASLSTTVAPASSTAFIGAATNAAADEIITSVATASTTAVGLISVRTKNANGSAAAESITATITGAGLLRFGTVSGSSLTIAGTGTSDIEVLANGTAGVGTITVSTPTATFAPKTVTFYAKSPKTITASVYNPVLVVGTNAKAVKATAVDANGIAWTGQLYIYASTAADALIGGSATAPVACSYDSTKLAHFCPITTKAVGTASFVVTDQSLATGSETAYAAAMSAATSSAVAVTVSNAAPATVKLAFDKATYQPYEKAIITVTVLDSTGKTLGGQTFANALATGGITSTQAFSSNGTTAVDLTPVSITTSADSSSTAPRTAGSYTYTVYMPSQGTVTISATGGTSLAAAGQVAVSASATISNSAVDAATDAALAAADAADAATAAAQDASDAVAALSATVATLVASLKAQITSLTNLVIKIQKKVKA